MINRVVLLAAATLLASPAFAEVESITKAPSQFFASGAKVGILWEGFYGRVPNHVIVQNPADTLSAIGATEGTLHVKCENPKMQKGYATFNIPFNLDTASKWTWYNGVNGAVNRICPRIISIYARIEPGADFSVDDAVDILSDGGYGQPFRLTVRGDTDYGPLGDEVVED